MAWNYQKHFDEMVEALKSELKYVWYSDHTMDNHFVDCDLERTIRLIPEEYLPIGFCYAPEYSPCSGVGFALQERETGRDLWVHVPLICFEKWLDSVGLLTSVFPNGTRYIQKYEKSGGCL